MRVGDLNNLSHNDVCLWLDFYSQLLTDRTRDVLELHYSEDMSLSEIAENLGITRQAVHDRIRQGLLGLTQYEEKLGLVKRYRIQKNCIGETIRALESGDCAEALAQLRQLDRLI